MQNIDSNTFLFLPTKSRFEQNLIVSFANKTFIYLLKCASYSRCSVYSTNVYPFSPPFENHANFCIDSVLITFARNNKPLPNSFVIKLYGFRRRSVICHFMSIGIQFIFSQVSPETFLVMSPVKRQNGLHDRLGNSFNSVHFSAS